MSPELPSQSELQESLQAGREDMAQEIVAEFTAPLLILAKKQLGARLAQRIDPEDILQSVYRSFFKRVRGGEYAWTSGAELWRLLVTITLNKVRGQSKFHHAARRNVRAEEPDNAHLEDSLISTEATPEAAAILVEQVRSFLAILGPRGQAVLEYRLQGFSTSEIAERTGRSERSVRRVLEYVRSRLERFEQE